MTVLIQLKELCSVWSKYFYERLQEMGIQMSNIHPARVTMETDKFIVLREKIGRSARVVILDVANPKDLLRRPISADSALMNPKSKILALRFGKKVVIYDVDGQSEIKTADLALASEDVVFWKWINGNIIRIVTKSSVYHWALEGDSAPVKMFDRDPTLVNTQIIDYRSDADVKSLLLLGITVKDSRMVGAMQLYNTERKASQSIEGHAACFIQFKMEGNQRQSNLFCYTLRSQNGGRGKFHIVEIYTVPCVYQPYNKN